MRDFDSFDAYTAQINARRAALRESMAAPAPKATATVVKVAAPKVRKVRKARAPRVVRDAAVEWCTERGLGGYGETPASRDEARARLNEARARFGLAPITYKV